MNEQQYISDVIGEDYKHWNRGDIILITAPTGSGKSFFIMHNLLEEAINKKRPKLEEGFTYFDTALEAINKERPKPILYLVNETAVRKRT